MPKGSDTLTGGTKDVNPQWMKVAIQTPTSPAIAPGGETTLDRQHQFQLPIARIGPKEKKTIVMEFLKVRWSFTREFVFAGGLPPAVLDLKAWISTKAPQSSVELEVQGTTIDWFNYQDAVQLQASIGTLPNLQEQIYNGVQDLPIVHDLTDGAGHGMLIATDSMYIRSSLAGANGGLAGSGNVTYTADILCEILYRFKEVGITEYVGIVQSQQ